MTRQEIQFWDEEWAYVESFWNWIVKRDSTLKENNEIDYLGHIKAWIEVLNTKKDISELVKKRIDQIFSECDLNNIHTDNKWIAHFQKETNEKILNMIEVVLINYTFSQKK